MSKKTPNQTTPSKYSVMDSLKETQPSFHIFLSTVHKTQLQKMKTSGKKQPTCKENVARNIEVTRSQKLTTWDNYKPLKTQMEY